MNDELQNTANEALVSIIQNVTSAKEFILGEAPEVVNQLLLWHMINSLILFTTLLSLGLFLVIAGIRHRNKSRAALTDDEKADLQLLSEARSAPRFSVHNELHRLQCAIEDATTRIQDAKYRFIYYVSGGFLIYVAVVICTGWLQILIAPKVYLIEYAARLVS